MEIKIDLSHIEYEMIKSFLRQETLISISTMNVIICFSNKFNILKFKDRIIKEIHLSKINDYVEILKKINMQYKILNILALNSSQFSFLRTIYINIENELVVTADCYCTYIDLNNDDIVSLENKISDHLQFYGIEKDEINDIGYKCEQLIDLIYDQLNLYY